MARENETETERIVRLRKEREQISKDQAEEGRRQNLDIHTNPVGRYETLAEREERRRKERWLEWKNRNN